MAVVGLFAVAAPFLAPSPAGASSAHQDKSLTFVDRNGSTLTCTAGITADHRTEDPDQPYTQVIEGAGGDAGCLDELRAHLVVTYKDENGKARKSDIISSGVHFAWIGGTYSSVVATLTVNFDNCDPEESAACSITVTAAPK